MNRYGVKWLGKAERPRFCSRSEQRFVFFPSCRVYTVTLFKRYRKIFFVVEVCEHEHNRSPLCNGEAKSACSFMSWSCTPLRHVVYVQEQLSFHPLCRNSRLQVDLKRRRIKEVNNRKEITDEKKRMRMKSREMWRKRQGTRRMRGRGRRKNRGMRDERRREITSAKSTRSS